SPVHFPAIYSTARKWVVNTEYTATIPVNATQLAYWPRCRGVTTLRKIIMTYRLTGDYHRQVTLGVIEYTHRYADMDIDFVVGVEPSPEELPHLGDVAIIGAAGLH